ncbi:hypothetical protein AAG570_011685 [Ranatra chinensis]|uniref:Uncharacterized protein n=1 Tax=Ranatra chinensis TaxID=642074 RepID=A0ABD0YT21_9HEMI
MAAKRRNMFHKNKKQETTEIDPLLAPFAKTAGRLRSRVDLLLVLEDQSPTKARDARLNPNVSPAPLVHKCRNAECREELTFRTALREGIQNVAAWYLPHMGAFHFAGALSRSWWGGERRLPRVPVHRRPGLPGGMEQPLSRCVGVEASAEVGTAALPSIPGSLGLGRLSQPPIPPSAEFRPGCCRQGPLCSRTTSYLPLNPQTPAPSLARAKNHKKHHSKIRTKALSGRPRASHEGERGGGRHWALASPLSRARGGGAVPPPLLYPAAIRHSHYLRYKAPLPPRGQASLAGYCVVEEDLT